MVNPRSAIRECSVSHPCGSNNFADDIRRCSFSAIGARDAHEKPLSAYSTIAVPLRSKATTEEICTARFFMRLDGKHAVRSCSGQEGTHDPQLGSRMSRAMRLVKKRKLLIRASKAAIQSHPPRLPGQQRECENRVVRSGDASTVLGQKRPS